MVTKSTSVRSDDSVRKPKCHGRFFNEHVAECRACDLKATCRDVFMDKEVVEDPKPQTPPVETPPVETPPVETPPVETPPVETPPVEAQVQPNEEARPDQSKVKGTCVLEQLGVRAGSGQASALTKLTTGWFEMEALVAAVIESHGGKGTSAYDAVARAKKANLIQVRKSESGKEYHIEI